MFNIWQVEALSCRNFSAGIVGDNEGDDLIYTEYACDGDEAYLSRMDLKWGWWIDALLVACSDGSESEWFGDGSHDGNNSTAFFGGGLVRLSAYSFHGSWGAFPTNLTLYGYDVDMGYPDGMVIGPYG